MDEKKIPTVEYVNNAGTDNEVGVTDDIGVGMIQKQVENLYQERQAFLEGRETAIKNLKNYEEQWLVDKRLEELQLNNIGLIESNKAAYTHKIQLVPEFWELQKKKMEFQMRANRFQAERTIEGMNLEIVNATSRLEIIKEQLAEKIAKLKELGAEVPVDKTEDEQDDN